MEHHRIEMDGGGALSVAGPGARAYAFTVDWHVRVLIALVWMLVGLGIDRWLLDNPGFMLLGVLVPGALLYLLYHPVVELLMDGNSPGKYYAHVRIVTMDGRVPDNKAILLRNVFRLIDSLPLFYVVGIVSCLLTDRYRRIGDIVAGTVLVYETPRQSAPSVENAGNGRYSPAQIQALRSLLDRWDELDATVRVDLARRLLIKMGERSDSIDPKKLRKQLETMRSE